MTGVLCRNGSGECLRARPDVLPHDELCAGWWSEFKYEPARPRNPHPLSTGGQHFIQTRTSSMSTSLNGKRVAILLTDGFEQIEMTSPRDALTAAGAIVELVAPHPGEITGWHHTDPGD